MSKAIVYARVSSLAQSRDDRVSLDEQEEACREYAAGKGYTVLDAVREVEIAATVRKRPLLLDAMRRVKAGEAEVLLAYCVDRLTREQAGMFIIDEEVQRGKGRIEFATESYDDTAIGRFTRSARAFAAEVELERIAARSSMGRRTRMQAGKLLVSGNPLLGYRYAGERKERYEPDPAQAPVVQRIFAEFVGGKSINRITNDLNDAGVPTSTGRGTWHKPQVWKVLRNRAYLGEARMMRRKYHSGESGREGFVWRAEEETVLLPEGTIPPLVDQVTFDRAQLRLEKNKEALHDPQAKTDVLLRGGFVKCGECGFNMVTVRQSKYTYYKCQTSERKKGACVWHAISATALDAAVWSRVEAILGEPERLRRILAIPVRDIAAEIAEVGARIEELRREGATLARTVARLGEGDDAAEGLLDEMREVTQRRRALEEARQRLQAEAEDGEARARRVEATIEAVSGVSGPVAALDHEGRRQVLIDLDVMVAVYPSRHDSPYHWVMKAFDRDDRGEHLWLDSGPAAAKSYPSAHRRSSKCTSAATGSR